jgi:hypothetical protein
MSRTLEPLIKTKCLQFYGVAIIDSRLERDMHILVDEHNQRRVRGVVKSIFRNLVAFFQVDVG